MVRLAQLLDTRVEPELPQDLLEAIVECMSAGAGNLIKGQK